jgi:hypothetical protein
VLEADGAQPPGEGSPRSSMWWAATRTAKSTATVALPAPLRSQNWVVAGGNPAGRVDPPADGHTAVSLTTARPPDRASTDCGGSTLRSCRRLRLPTTESRPRAEGTSRLPAAAPPDCDDRVVVRGADVHQVGEQTVDECVQWCAAPGHSGGAQPTQARDHRGEERSAAPPAGRCAAAEPLADGAGRVGGGQLLQHGVALQWFPAHLLREGPTVNARPAAISDRSCSGASTGGRPRTCPASLAGAAAAIRGHRRPIASDRAFHE